MVGSFLLSKTVLTVFISFNFKFYILFTFLWKASLKYLIIINMLNLVELSASQ